MKIIREKLKIFKKLPMYEKLLCIYFLLKPYYIFDSGKLQISDAFLVFSFLMMLFKNKLKFSKKKKKNVFLFFCFWWYVVALNLYYFSETLDSSFGKSILFYTFNLMGVVLFTKVFRKRKFLRLLKSIIFFNLSLQLIILFFSLNKLSYRYQGTFNDPNQFGFYVFISIIYFYIIENLLTGENRNYSVCVISFVLILFSASIGMSFGLLMFYIILFLGSFKFSRKIVLNMALVAIVGSAFFYFNKELVISKYEFLGQRIEIKAKKIDVKKKGNVFEMRGLDKIYKNPQYLLFGSGEGEMSRLNSFHFLEVHSTFLGIFLYYGLVGLFFLTWWLYRNIYPRKDTKLFLLLVPLFIESFTLAHQRQVLFWGAFILSGYSKEYKRLRRKVNERRISVSDNANL